MKIIIAVIAIMFGAANANAEIDITIPTYAEVTKMVIEANPIASLQEIDSCYTAMKEGGFYKIHSSKVRIVCSKNELTRVWE